MLKVVRPRLSGRNFARAAGIAGLAALVGSLACADRNGPTSVRDGDSSRLAVRTRFVKLGADDGLPINRIRIRVRERATGTLIGELAQTVDENSPRWNLSLDVSLADGGVVAVVVIELINVTNGEETVQWSGSRELSIDPTELQPVADVEVFRGPPENLTVTDLQITPPATALAEGRSQQLHASVTGSTNAKVFWSSLDPSVARATANGLVTGIAAGKGRVVAVAGPRSDTVSLTVLQRVTALELTPATGRVESFGAELEFAARAVDVRGSTVDAVVVEWSSSDGNVAEHIGSGRFRAVGNGTATITAAAQSDPTIHASTSFTVEQRAIQVSLTPPTVRFHSTSGSLQLEALARDANGNAVSDAQFVWTSSNPLVATVDKNGNVAAVGTGSMLIRARTSALPSGMAWPDDTISGTAEIIVSQSIAGIAVEPDAHTFSAFGETRQYSAIVTDSAGAIVPNAAVTWSAANLGTATISTNGLVEAIANGSTQIVARIGNVTGATQTTVLQTITRIDLSPTRDTLRSAGATRQFTATLRDRNNHAVTGRPATWSSSDTAVAMVNQAGLATARAAGTASIVVSAAGVWSSATLVVELTSNPPPPPPPPPPPVITIASVTVTPETISVTSGRTTILAATARDSRSVVLTGVSFAWSSADTAIAVVDANGTVTGKRTGTVAITAWAGTQNGSASVTVLPGVAHLLSRVSGDGQAGQQDMMLAQPLVVRVTDAAGNPISGVAVQFVVTAGGGSTDPVNAATDAAGLARTRWTPGSVSSAQTLDVSSSSLSGSPVRFSASVILTESVASIAVAPATHTFTAFNETRQFSAIVRDHAGNVLPSAVVTWSTQNVAVATIATDGLLKALGSGSTDVIARIGTVSGWARVTVLQTIARIDVSPAVDTLRAIGATRPFNATARDRNDFVIVGQPMTWTSSRTTVASIDPNGLALAVASGSTTIAATSEGVTGTAALVVKPASISIASVTVTPQTVSVAALETTTLTATARDAQGRVLTGVDFVWTTANAEIATVDANGLVSGKRAGTVVITAIAGDRSGTAIVTVVTPVVAYVITAVSGNGQVSSAGQPLAKPLVVRVTDRFNNPASGITVQFTVTAGGGRAEPVSAITNAAGVAQTKWTLGSAGTQTLEATAAGPTGPQLVFTATVSSSPAAASTPIGSNKPN